MDDTAASLDIWLVRVLRTLLVERSVTQTALRLNQTQPAISTALRKLRETLNDPILVRGKSGMANRYWRRRSACCAKSISSRHLTAISIPAARAARSAWPRPII
jgi:hypothetical protein